MHQLTKTTTEDSYIDLHCHLDGAVTVEIAKALAKLQNLTLPTDHEKDLKALLTVPKDCNNLNDFLKCFALPLSLMQTYEGLREAARCVCNHLKENRVVYAELRYAPQLHTTQGMTQKETIQAVLAGMQESDLKANLILCCMRGRGNEAENDETLKLTDKFLVEDGGVVAMDLAGAEALFPTENYRDLFAKAKSLNIPFTIHAGEADGAESVRLAVEYGARRIGHGVRSREDANLLKQIAEKGIVLEMCPTSNRQTKAIVAMSDYPLMAYLNMGIKVTLNTDDPAIEGTEIAKEYRYMEETFGLTKTQKKILMHNAIEGAFTNEETRKKLRSLLSDIAAESQ